MATGYLKYVELTHAEKKIHTEILNKWGTVLWTSFTHTQLVRFEALELASKTQDDLFHYFPDHNTILLVGVISGTNSFKVTVSLLRKGFVSQILARSHKVIISPFPEHLCKYILNGGPPSKGDPGNDVFYPVSDARSSIAIYSGPGFSNKSHNAVIQRTIAINDAISHAGRASVEIGKHLKSRREPPITVAYSGAICSQIWPRYRKKPPYDLLIQRQPQSKKRGLFNLATETDSIYSSAPDADQIINQWHFGYPSHAFSFFYYPPLSIGIASDYEITPGKISRLVNGKIAQKAVLETPLLSPENKQIINTFTLDNDAPFSDDG